jgi:hypothetical protein
VLTACTDIPPYNNTDSDNDAEKDPITYNTTATYTVSPTQVTGFSFALQKKIHHSKRLCSLAFSQITIPTFNQKDVSCQTSDCEIIFKKKDKANNAENPKRQPKLYDYRRNTDSMLPSQKFVDEEKLFTVSQP